MIHCDHLYSDPDFYFFTLSCERKKKLMNSFVSGAIKYLPLTGARASISCSHPLPCCSLSTSLTVAPGALLSVIHLLFILLVSQTVSSLKTKQALIKPESVPQLDVQVHCCWSKAPLKTLICFLDDSGAPVAASLMVRCKDRKQGRPFCLWLSWWRGYWGMWDPRKTSCENWELKKEHSSINIPNEEPHRILEEKLRFFVADTSTRLELTMRTSWGVHGTFSDLRIIFRWWDKFGIVELITVMQ